MRHRMALPLPLSLLCIVLAGCSKSDRVTAPAVSTPGAARRTFSAGELNEAVLQSHTFTPGSTNPYFPLVPGTVFTYRSKTKDGVEIDVMTVTDQTQVIRGVTTRVVQDDVRLDGVLTEHTFDWFAQDELGNVWYFGEDSQSIDPGTGEVSTAGSWQAGKAGADAGIIMEARPQAGDSYNEENAAPIAQDQARVIALDARAKVPYGKFDHCLETENTSALESGALENKFYAPRVGLLLEVDVTERTRNELVSVTGPSGREREHGHGRRHDEDEARSPEKRHDHQDGREDAD